MFSTLASYENEPRFINVDATSDNLLVREYGASFVYLISGGKKRHIVSEGVFESKGYNWADVIDVSLQILNQFPKGINISNPPSVTITAPVADSTVVTSTVTVSGTATDDIGVISLTVNGIAVALTSGSFSTSVNLISGANTIKVIAKDEEGNSNTKTVTVTYVPNQPPNPVSIKLSFLKAGFPSKVFTTGDQKYSILTSIGNGITVKIYATVILPDKTIKYAYSNEWPICIGISEIPQFCSLTPLMLSDTKRPLYEEPTQIKDEKYIVWNAYEMKGDELPGEYIWKLWYEEINNPGEILASSTASYIVSYSRPEILRLIIQEETKNIYQVSIDGQDYTVATLNHYINPNTLKIFDYSDEVRVYLDNAGNPVGGGELSRKIGVVDYINKLQKTGLRDQLIQKQNEALKKIELIGTLPMDEWKLDTFELIIQLPVTAGKKLIEKLLEYAGLYFIELGVGDGINLYFDSKDKLLEEAEKDYLDSSKSYLSAWREIETGKDIIEYAMANKILQNSSVGDINYKKGEFIYRNLYKDPRKPITLTVTELVKMGTIGTSETIWASLISLDYDIVFSEEYGKSQCDISKKPYEATLYTLELAQSPPISIEYNSCINQVEVKIKQMKQAIEDFPYINTILGLIHSPGELRIYDSQNRVTGLVNGEIKEEIPNSIYDSENKTVVIFNTSDTYRYEIVGTDTGIYGLDILSFNDSKLHPISFTEIPTSLNETHQYTANLNNLSDIENVTIKTDSDGDGIFEKTNTIHLPDALFEYTPVKVFVNQNVNLNASLSYDPDGNIVAYNWDFGDGTNASGEIVNHIYSSEGVYLVTLTVKDDTGAVDKKTIKMRIDETPPASISIINQQTIAGSTYINFTWLNPPDPDFSHVMLYLNGTFKTNITAPQNYFNVTGLQPDTGYELGTHTVDTSGNINQTWVNATARTAPDTTIPTTGPIHNVNKGINYTTIQAAINDASPGNEIHVDSGTYFENVNVNKQLILRGIDNGGGKPVVNAGGIGNAITLSAGNSTLEGFIAANVSIWPNAGIKVNSNNNLIKNNNASNNAMGINLYSASNNTLTNNIARLNGVSGINLESANNNILNGNNASNNYYGIFLRSASNNTLTNNIASSNAGNGIFMRSASNYNILTSNTASLNMEYGIYIMESANNNTIYNNYFNNTNNVQFDGSNINIWNITKQQGTNIIGDSYFGGNFWAYPDGTGFSQTCEDGNKDGICDSAYTLDSTNIDYLPLAYNATTVIPSITVTSSNGGENWERGKVYAVSWNYTGNPGTNVKIELLKNGVPDHVITPLTSIGSGGSGSYNWLINSTQTLSADYKIRVTSTTNPAYTDTSDNNFNISAQTGVNLIKNPGFESGTISWLFHTNGTGTFTATSPGYEGTKAAKLVMNTSGTNIQLYQIGITLEENTRYRLSFASYSTKGHDLTMKLYKHVAPYTLYGLNQTFDLSTSWQTFMTEFTSENFTGTVNDGRFQFWLVPFAAAGDTYYIDNVRLEKVQDTSDPVHNINKDTHYTTIQAAINNATPGDEIRVDSGIYPENVNVTKQLTLRGIGMPVVDANGSGSAITLSANGSTLEGFTATGYPDAGIKVTSNNNTLIGNNDNMTSGGIGIYLSSSSNNTLRGNVMGSSDAIYLSSSNNNILINNSASGFFTGISLFSSSNNNLSYNFAGGMLYGISMQSSDNNTLIGNTATSDKLEAIFLYSSNNNIIYHNNILDYSAGDYGNNLWDSGYPSGGNYWSDYTGTDSNNDGIGDTPYPISGGSSVDRYPLMAPYTGEPPTPPQLKIAVVSPNSGENWERGKVNVISWNHTGDSGTYVKIELLKAGVLNRVIAASTLNDGLHPWLIPVTQIPGIDYKVRITSTTNTTYTDTSDSNFIIPTPNITVSTPNGGENWRRGTIQTIRWNSSGSPGTYVKIELLKAGILNRVIIASTPNDGVHPWLILPAQAPGTDYKVRITSTTNASYNDTSDNSFIIPVPSITVLTPNGTESWIRGTTKIINWSSTESPGTYVKIELLKAGVLNRVIIASTLNDGSHPWLIPGTQAHGTDYQVRITSTANVSIRDTSDNNFTIPVPSITVVTPNGGETWRRGTTQTIKWTSTESPGTYVKIELLKAGVLNRVIVASTLNDGSHPWLIPGTQAHGTDYQVRITSTANVSIRDTSDNNFTIPVPSITVATPNGGENWTRGTTKTISWNSTESPWTYVKIELLKAGVLNRVIVASTINDGSHPWLIPGTQAHGTDYQVRITSTANVSIKDTSDNNFTIPVPSITVVTPNGGETWRRGTTQTIKWTSTESPGTYVKIELLKAGVLNRVIVASTINDGSHPWPILAAQTLGSDYKIRINSTINPAITDSGNNNFNISS